MQVRCDVAHSVVVDTRCAVVRHAGLVCDRRSAERVALLLDDVRVVRHRTTAAATGGEAECTNTHAKAAGSERVESEARASELRADGAEVRGVVASG